VHAQTCACSHTRRPTQGFESKITVTVICAMSLQFMHMVNWWISGIYTLAQCDHSDVSEGWASTWSKFSHLQDRCSTILYWKKLITLHGIKTHTPFSSEWHMTWKPEFTDICADFRHDFTWKFVENRAEEIWMPRHLSNIHVLVTKQLPAPYLPKKHKLWDLKSLSLVWIKSVEIQCIFKFFHPFQDKHFFIFNINIISVLQW
jgi:hypothetical protein